MARTEQLRQALDLTDQILVAIEQGEMESIAELDHQRQAIIQQYYRSNQDIDGDLTRKLKQANDQVVTRLYQLQRQTRERQLQLRQSTQASQAYRVFEPR